MILQKYKNRYIAISSIFLIILMAYAAVVKGADIGLFQKQIMESPLIPLSITRLVSFIIPASELLGALLLLYQPTRFWGFLLSYFLMLIFSVYLVTLVKLFGANLPCACGGILGQMGYTTHIVFNIFFCIMAFVSTILTVKDSNTLFLKNELILTS
jgi:Methylamine utilisation protein MauE